MRDFEFPSCFGENGVQVADASSSCSNLSSVSKSSQNSVTCLYKSRLFGKSCLIAVIWSRNLMGHCVSVEIDDVSSYNCICKVDVKPSLFSKRKGSKCLQLLGAINGGVEVYWDLSSAKFGPGPEPVEGYYIAVVCKKEMVLAVGDLREEALKKSGAFSNSIFSNAALISKREHILGKRVFTTKAQFCDGGKIHDLEIEFDSGGGGGGGGGDGGGDPGLVVRIDRKTAMRVVHLRWKFRGNCAVTVDGMPVEVYWDVHNWLFGSCVGSAVFMFRSEKVAGWGGGSPMLSGCRELGLSTSTSWSFRDAELPGFCLFLYAWKSE
ncbi:uncharacterized protein LOC127249006 [Andrographis paniculata]|uniref:uncharacterized protein LOC127249006 n=1 Tax=Andrographis paniculata TaxID=175694 RepID=UPI0021E87015|nr:uncharacterized protein LOC127249006 [Andrographis paniculata]